jgi:hypothetical protein
VASRGDPQNIPEWHSVGREAALVRHLIGSGVTALGRANYADKLGEYYTAFFGLSVGMERLSKLILVVNHAILNSGRMPAASVIQKFGHELIKLMDASDAVATRNSLRLRHPRPIAGISVKIIECLDAFADARRGRYANFAALGNPNLSQDEPIRKWWNEIAEAILAEHYYGKPVQTRVEERARVVDAMMSAFSSVQYTNEVGHAMRDMRTASLRTGQTRIVQQYGRFYALITARWLSEVFSELARSACYSHNIHAFYGVWECFQDYTVDNDLLKTRKIWPLT